jgi:glycosyltransferase involved in cell wall biosynthesis
LNNSPRISVVINNYNYERYLSEAIDSALAQTYSNCEVIVVDDGSTDGSRSVIASYGEQIHSIFKENGGQASAFNIGITAASGKYILLLDSDDVLLPNAVSVALESMNQDVVRLTYQMDKITAGGTLIGGFVASGPETFEGTLGEAVTGFGFFPSTPTSGNFFRADALKQSLPIPEEQFRISADLYIFCKNAEFGKIQRIAECLAKYRIHGNNNFASAVGRFGISAKQLRNNVANFGNTYALLCEYAANTGELTNRQIKDFVVTMRSIELLSDARMLGVDCESILQWSRWHTIKSAFSAIFRCTSLKALPRNFFGLLTILANECLPQRIALLNYRLLEHLFSKKIGK